MTLKKTNWTNREALIQKAAIVAILKSWSLVLLVIGAVFFTIPSFAQEKKDSTASVKSPIDNAFNEIMEYSRPGKNHALLADVVGTWSVKGKHFNWTDSVTNTVAMEYSVTVVRKSFANGRYFISDVTSDGKLQMPIQDGKMKEVPYQGVEIEGYDNVKKKFVRASIGNHMLSGIPVSEGVYDPATKTITFDEEIEMAPGQNIKQQLRFIFIDKDHYKWEGYRQDNGKFRLETEMNFTRVSGK